MTIIRKNNNIPIEKIDIFPWRITMNLKKRNHDAIKIANFYCLKINFKYICSKTKNVKIYMKTFHFECEFRERFRLLFLTETFISVCTKAGILFGVEMFFKPQNKSGKYF